MGLRQAGATQGEVFYLDEADIDLNPRIGLLTSAGAKQLVVLTPGTNVRRYVARVLNARSGKVVWVAAERKNPSLSWRSST